MPFFYGLRVAATALFLSTYGNVHAQQAGNLEQEGNPTINLKKCTIAGGCTSAQAKVTLDANWRWIHTVQGSQNCYTGNSWDDGICSDPTVCAQNCALEQVSANKYSGTYGVEQLPNGVKLNFVTNHQYGTNVGSRLYVMNPNDDSRYEMFYLKNREFSLDIDVSNLFCGMNGAMYFVEMDEQGGYGLGNNNAGAKYGTGYCDAQCPHDIKFIDGEANSVDWNPNPKDFSNNMGAGKYGSCCAEMDIWEANSMATAYTPHPCDNGVTQLRCEGIACGDTDKGERYDGVCDKDGCDINPYRMGNPNFYGRGPEFEVNTLQPMTAVTQFLTSDGTDAGDLSEIRRLYIQNGKVIESPFSTILGQAADTDSITNQFCVDKKTLFQDVNDYMEKGGTKAMGDSLDRGQVLALSLWDDVEVNMLWLDSAYPLDKPVTDPGVKRGECPGGDESTPQYLRNTYPDGYVTFQNAAIGEIGSTFSAPTNPPTPTPAPAPTTPTDSGCYSNNYKDCNHEDVEASCDMIWLSNGAQDSCIALWGACTGQTNGCCKPSTCVGDGTYAQCVKPLPTNAPFSSPTPPPVPTPPPTTVAPNTPNPTPTPITPNPITPSPVATALGCCTQNFKDCVTWCGEGPKTEAECTCNADVYWMPGPKTGCNARWVSCTNDVNACCDGLECVGNQYHRQCEIEAVA